MRKTISTIILTLALMVPSIVEAYTTIDTDGRIRINMVCQKIDVSKSAEDIHRTPPRIPVVYFDSTTSILYFETPCYDCSIELVMPGTDIIVYSAIIPDGEDVFQIPAFITGTYELHIHRGSVCFRGIIDVV